MQNIVGISGRLTKDVDFKQTPNGVSVAKFTLAVQRNYKDNNGDYQADFINCVAFRGAADIASNYLSKGDICNVSGRIQTRNFDNKEGQRIFITEVVADQIQLISTGRENGSYSQNTQQQQFQTKQQNGWQQQQYKPKMSDPFANASGPIDLNDDDLPF